MGKLVVFVGGIHGVGKTTFCRELAAQTTLSHKTVSAIIKDECASIDFDLSKESNRLDVNQHALLNWLEKNRGREGLILDGHFTLLDKSQGFYNVDVEVFKLIDPVALICLESSTDLIVRRLEQRDGKIWSSDLVQRLARNERDRANHIALALNIPIRIITIHDISAAKHFVTSLME